MTLKLRENEFFKFWDLFENISPFSSSDLIPMKSTERKGTFKQLCCCVIKNEMNVKSPNISKTQNDEMKSF